MSDESKRPSSADLEGLISSGPDATRALLAALRAGTIKPSQVNTPGLAFLVASTARETLSVPWLSVANEIYEYLAQEIGGWTGEEQIRSAMLLRAYFIDRLGVDEREKLLQVGPIADWFLTSLPRTLEEAVAGSKRWKALPSAEKMNQIEEVRVPRGIKNRLFVCELLEKSDLLGEYPAIKAWLAIHPELP
jgi:hypothetical protein